MSSIFGAYIWLIDKILLRINFHATNISYFLWAINVTVVHEIYLTIWGYLWSLSSIIASSKGKLIMNCRKIFIVLNRNPSCVITTFYSHLNTWWNKTHWWSLTPFYINVRIHIWKILLHLPYYTQRYLDVFVCVSNGDKWSLTILERNITDEKKIKHLCGKEMTPLLALMR